MPSEAVGCTQWAPETHPYEQAGSYCLPHTSVITASMLKLIAFTELKQNAPEILGCAGRWGLGYSAHPSLWMLQGATSRKEQPSKPCELARARVDAGPHCLCLSLFPQQSVPASSPLEHGNHKEVSLCKITGFKDIIIYLFIYLLYCVSVLPFPDPQHPHLLHECFLTSNWRGYCSETRSDPHISGSLSFLFRVLLFFKP